MARFKTFCGCTVQNLELDNVGVNKRNKKVKTIRLDISYKSLCGLTLLIIVEIVKLIYSKRTYKYSCKEHNPMLIG